MDLLDRLVGLEESQSSRVTRKVAVDITEDLEVMEWMDVTEVVSLDLTWYWERFGLMSERACKVL
jgi:hypothetical protein